MTILNTKPTTIFNSKLLLFGEYGLMFDAMALSVPFDRFSGYLDFDVNHSHQESSTEILKFYEYLKTGNTNQKLHFPFDLERFETDLAKGMYFNSNIPQQYGIGSSGALVAALFSRYSAGFVPKNKPVPELLKVDFALLESFFHGKSSGIDPLTSFINKALVIDSEKQIRTVDFDLKRLDLAIALIDTKTTGATAPLVRHFTDLFNLPEFEQAFYEQFIPANNGCIESFMKNDKTTFFRHLEQLVRFEKYHFYQMVPANFHRVISFAHCEKVYIKLLGSGGGGYLLAFAESQSVIDQWSAKRGVELMKVC
jgi:mevalonate kinase